MDQSQQDAGDQEASTESEPEEVKPPAAGEEGPNRRRSVRAKTIKKGQIVWQDGHCDMECLILDLSSGGAKIQTDEVFKCPDRFTLNTLTGESYHCEVVRRTPRDLGVRFLGRDLPKVLLVCDDKISLEAYEAELRKYFTLHSARGLKEAMATMDRKGPFAVVFSDMLETGRTGIWVLTEARKRDPSAARVFLGGSADLAMAVDAINEANVFRFHTKPCKLQDIIRSIEDGVAENRRQTEEQQP